MTAMYTNTCPICGESDCIQRVSAILAEDTNLSVNVGAVFAGGHLDPGVFGGVSRSALAMRLQPRKQPPGDISWGAIIFLILLASFVTGIILESIWFPSAPFTLDTILGWSIFTFMFTALSMPAWMALMIPTIFIYGMTRPRARRRYFENLAYLNAAYYCHRDGVVFDGVTHGAPESFVAFVFANSR